MRIVNHEEFMKLPVNTLYSEYKPCVFSGLKIKVSSSCLDFAYLNLIGNIDSYNSEDFFDKLHDAGKDDSVSLKLDFEAYSRDGMFDHGQLFAIYEDEDVRQLTVTLLGCLP